MRIPALCLSLALLVPQARAQTLPELGDTSGALLSPNLERRIGEQAMREIRLREPSFLDDPELTEYVNEIGRRIVAASPGARQDFEFFMVRDNTINAFAMPGGFVGVHTGLLLAAQTESELAGVLAHEVAHVTQHHLARLLGKQEQMSIPTLAAVVLGLLAARAHPDLAQAVIVGAGATGIQSQLNYTRDFEREADRIGFQFLQQAGFDVGGMGSFFERMQKATRLYENNAPAYLRTHPLTTERIADMQNRAQTAEYKQAPDSIEFHLARAKLRAEQGLPREAVAHFSELVREHRYAEEATLARAPNYRPLHYAYVEVLQGMGEHQAALAWLADLVKSYPQDARMYGLQAKSYAASGKRLLHHQALAETYVLQGTLPAAIEQLQLAQKSGDGDFYQLSAVDARLRDLRSLQAEEKKTARGQ